MKDKNPTVCLGIKAQWWQILMEHLLDVSMFHCSPFRTIIGFNALKYKHEPVEHAIEICVSKLLHDSFSGTLNILEKDVNLQYRYTFEPNTDGKSLMERFSASEMGSDSVREKISERIRFFVRRILSNELTTVFCMIDNVRCLQDNTIFHAISGIDGITKITFVFQITKNESGETTIICTMTSALTALRKAKLGLKKTMEKIGF